MPGQKLEQLESSFVTEQLLNGDEVYIENFTLQEFEECGFEFLKYIDSHLLRKILITKMKEQLEKDFYDQVC